MVAVMIINEKYYQFGIYIVVNCLSTIYYLFIFPFENIVDNLIYIITDISIVSLCLVYCLLLKYGDDQSISRDTYEEY